MVPRSHTGSGAGIQLFVLYLYIFTCIYLYLCIFIFLHSSFLQLNICWTHTRGVSSHLRSVYLYALPMVTDLRPLIHQVLEAFSDKLQTNSLFDVCRSGLLVLDVGPCSRGKNQSFNFWALTHYLASCVCVCVCVWVCVCVCVCECVSVWDIFSLGFQLPVQCWHANQLLVVIMNWKCDTRGSVCVGGSYSSNEELSWSEQRLNHRFVEVGRLKNHQTTKDSEKIGS